MNIYWIGVWTCAYIMVRDCPENESSFWDNVIEMFLILCWSLIWPLAACNWCRDLKASLPLPPKPSSTVSAPEPMGKVKEGVE